eukprot:TRINITY_DN32735_c0_g1_i1.p1 TRINITY_DN32735_c0_g1~~TRINITY_DN32735_c0_g1_i1.p1  ORF type:complete len:569 (+),score=75.59 TRINITY_DN32735_c0_g1_i1:114-1709(+)
MSLSAKRQQPRGQAQPRRAVGGRRELQRGGSSGQLKQSRRRQSSPTSVVQPSSFGAASSTDYAMAQSVLSATSTGIHHVSTPKQRPQTRSPSPTDVPVPPAAARRASVPQRRVDAPLVALAELAPQPVWKPDYASQQCEGCAASFSVFLRRHHCRGCGWLFCGSCSRHRTVLPLQGLTGKVRVCTWCFEHATESSRSSAALSRRGSGAERRESQTGIAVHPSHSSDSIMRAPSGSMCAPEAASEDLAEGCSSAPRLGDRVLARGAPGWVRCVRSRGDQMWVGMELDLPHGRGDGSSWFCCRSGYALFVQQQIGSDQVEWCGIPWVSRDPSTPVHCTVCSRKMPRRPLRCQICMCWFCGACADRGEDDVLEMCRRCTSALAKHERSMRDAGLGGKLAGLNDASARRGGWRAQQRRGQMLRSWLDARRKSEAPSADAEERFVDTMRREDIKRSLGRMDVRGVAGIHPRATPKEVLSALEAKLTVWHPTRASALQPDVVEQMCAMFTQAHKAFLSCQEAEGAGLRPDAVGHLPN